VQFCGLTRVVVVNIKDLTLRTYVAVGREVKGKVRLVEVIYVGTHEKAPY